MQGIQELGSRYETDYEQLEGGTEISNDSNKVTNRLLKSRAQKGQLTFILLLFLQLSQVWTKSVYTISSPSLTGVSIPSNTTLTTTLHGQRIYILLYLVICRYSEWDRMSHVRARLGLILRTINHNVPLAAAYLDQVPWPLLCETPGLQIPKQFTRVYFKRGVQPKYGVQDEKCGVQDGKMWSPK